MTRYVRRMVVGVVTLAFALGFLVASDNLAADEREDVLKLAKKIAAGEDVKKDAKAMDKADLEEVMKTMKLRKDGGHGFGKAGGMYDGIEIKLQNIGKKPLTAKQIADDGEALIQAANIVAAIGEVAIVKTPSKKQGAKDPKDWKQWSEDMVKSSNAMAKEVKAKNPAGILKEVKNLNASCANCHGVFRD